jgi:hypothetical protein
MGVMACIDTRRTQRRQLRHRREGQTRRTLLVAVDAGGLALMTAKLMSATSCRSRERIEREGR